MLFYFIKQEISNQKGAKWMLLRIIVNIFLDKDTEIRLKARNGQFVCHFVVFVAGKVLKLHP